MSENPRTRMRGACLQCARNKRKCDHKHPQCSRCTRLGLDCEAQRFKVSTTSVPIKRRSARNPTSPPSKVARVAPKTPAAAAETGESSPNLESQSDGPGPDVQSDAATQASEIPTMDLSVVSNVTGQLSLEALDTTHDPPEFGINPEAVRSFLDSLVALPTLFEEDTRYPASPQPSISNGLAITGPNLQFPPQVPQRLYCPMPWPDDMLASPERRFLWDYFLKLVEADFLCVDWEDVGHLLGFQHPYISTLPYMALSNAALRGAVLCYSASQYELRHSGKNLRRTRALTCSESVQAISFQLVQDTTDDGSLLAAICAACLLHYFGTERHNYLRMGSKLVNNFLRKARPRASLSFGSHSDVPLTEFRWSVISTLCSLQGPAYPLDNQRYLSIEMSDEEIKQKYSNAFESWVSHPLYGFSPLLVNPLLRIGRLLERQLSQLDGTVAAHDPDDQAWKNEVFKVEEMLLQARERDLDAQKSPYGSADPASVMALNESMYAAGFLLLYARLKGLPFTAPFVRKQTKLITDEVSKIQQSSSVSYGIIFPLFIAGCEAVESQIREEIRDRIRDPRGVTFYRGDLLGALDHIWGIRDSNPGLSWPDWVGKVDPRYRIPCLM